jgi:hypothetical protein
VETVLDPTYLRPGIITRATVIGLAALAVGAGLFLACFGLSYLWHHDPPVLERLDAMNATLEKIAQRPDRTDEILAKLDRLNVVIGSRIDQLDIAPIRGTLDQRLAIIEGRIIEEIKKQRPIIMGDTGPGTDRNGNVITKEVTVFHNIAHESGTVVTGWMYPDGASADQRPTRQYCYWTISKLDGTSAVATIHIAVNSTRLPNIASGVPRLEAALQKCVWWSGAGQ